jgi:hypothetical protein
MNSTGRLFTFRSPARQRTPVTEIEIYIVLGFCFPMRNISKFHFLAYFSSPEFGDVISRDGFKLIMKFLYFADNNNKVYYEDLQTFTKSFLSYHT